MERSAVQIHAVIAKNLEKMVPVKTVKTTCEHPKMGFGANQTHVIQNRYLTLMVLVVYVRPTSASMVKTMNAKLTHAPVPSTFWKRAIAHPVPNIMNRIKQKWRSVQWKNVQHLKGWPEMHSAHHALSIRFNHPLTVNSVKTQIVQDLETLLKRMEPVNNVQFFPLKRWC